MAVTQSRTQVNDKASGAEPMQKLNPSAVVPGQSINDIGGPTVYDYSQYGDSAKIENEGTSQVRDQVNDKAGAAADTGGGTGGASLAGGEILPSIDFTGPLGIFSMHCKIILTLSLISLILHKYRS